MKNLRALLAVALFALALSSMPGVQAGPPPPDPGVLLHAGKNLNAAVLIVDYASMSQNQVVANETACADACKAHYPCNGYTYCTNPSGCGSGCSTYVSNNGGKLPAPSGSTNYRTQSLPVVVPGSFSPFASGCNGDKWPHRTCSLKKVATPRTPVFWNDPVAAGWTSGVLVDLNGSGQCDSMPFGVCGACAAYWDPSPFLDTFFRCMSCANAVTSALGTAGANTMLKSTAHWACTWCLTNKVGDKTYNRTSCLGCAAQNALTGLPNLCVR